LIETPAVVTGVGVGEGVAPGGVGVGPGVVPDPPPPQPTEKTNEMMITVARISNMGEANRGTAIVKTPNYFGVGTLYFSIRALSDQLNALKILQLRLRHINRPEWNRKVPSYIRAFISSF
jgi:hypothetical protein